MPLNFYEIFTTLGVYEQGLHVMKQAVNRSARFFLCSNPESHMGGLLGVWG